MEMHQELLILAVEVVVVVIQELLLGLKEDQATEVPVSSSSHTHHKYLKNHNGIYWAPIIRWKLP
jgi:hypothetical protein